MHVSSHYYQIKSANLNEGGKSYDTITINISSYMVFLNTARVPINLHISLSLSSLQGPTLLSLPEQIHIAIDVAQGCHYLEQQHFIHRDIAARNCLVTSKGSDRVVKIGGET